MEVQSVSKKKKKKYKRFILIFIAILDIGQKTIIE